MLVKTSYEFIFDPSDLQITDRQTFDGLLASWLSSMGLEAHSIDSGANDITLHPISVFICKKPDIMSPPQNQEKITSPKQQLSRVKQMKNPQGRYV